MVLDDGVVIPRPDERKDNIRKTSFVLIGL